MREFEREWKLIRPKDIVVDPLYQRELDDKRVNRMVKKFNPNLVNPPKVSFRDGKYWVFDGQHTLAMWRAVKKDKPIECRVFYGMTWLDEMELFIEQNGEDKDPTTNDKLRAAFNGGDPDVKDMVRAAESAGVTVDFQSSKKLGRCNATSTLFKAYKQLSRQDFVAMLEAIMFAWPEDPDGLTNWIIAGLTKFYATYSGSFKQDDLKRVLQMVTPAAIIREGKGCVGRKDTVFARIILRIYNKKRTSRRLEDLL